MIVFANLPFQFPVPARAIVLGVPPPPRTSNVAVLEAVAVGAKVTLIVQLDFAAREPPQLLLCLKSPGSLPLILKLTFSAVLVATFDRVTCCALLSFRFSDPRNSTMSPTV